MMGDILASVQSASRLAGKTNIEVVFDVLKQAQAKPEVINNTIIVNIAGFQHKDMDLINEILYANFCNYTIDVMAGFAFAIIKENRRAPIKLNLEIG